MNGQPDPQAGSVALTRGHLHIWDIPSCIRFGDGSIPAWEFWVLPSHDIAKKHSLV
jgi:hypothetical protein